MVRLSNWITITAEGVLAAIPDADGVVGDLGGGSLELSPVASGKAASGITLPFGPLRLMDAADGKIERARGLVDTALDELPGEILRGTITEIAKTDLKVAPRELASGKQLPIRIDDQGIPRPVETSYQARVVLDEHDRPLLPGTGGRAKILVARQSLGRRLYRALGRTFNFRL